MRFIKFSFLTLTVGLIAGCGLHPQTDYGKQAHVTSQLSMPKGVTLRSGQDYYPLPRQPDLNAQRPSLAPPGSNLARFSKQPKRSPGKQHFSRAKWSEASHGEPILVLTEEPKTSWADVGKALHETDYQILDQDPSLSSYYVLDTKVTGNEVTEKTPIYRVYIQDGDNNSSKVVLMDENNNMVLAKTAKRILRELEQHLT